MPATESSPEASASRGGASERRHTADLKDVLAAHQNASTKRALWQLANTFIPYFLLWFAMYWALEVSLWLTVPLAVLSGWPAAASLITWTLAHIPVSKLQCKTLSLALELQQLSNSVRLSHLRRPQTFAQRLTKQAQ